MTEVNPFEAEDQPSPGTALALIDGMADDKLFSPGSITDAQLATMRSDWLAEAKMYDIATDKARTELKRFARPLQKLRTGIEARAKELTGATKRKIAAIDTEKRRLVLVVGEIEDEVLAPLTAWEQEEETRKATLSGIVSGIMAKQTFYPDISSLSAAIAELEAFDLSTMQEFKVSAESAIIAVLRVLKPNLASMEKAEAERVELEKLRAAEAKRLDDERIAAAAEKLAEEKIAAASTSVSQHPGETHNQAYNREAVEALMGCAITRREALAVLKAILAGQIPYVTMHY